MRKSNLRIQRLEGLSAYHDSDWPFPPPIAAMLHVSLKIVLIVTTPGVGLEPTTTRLTAADSTN